MRFNSTKQNEAAGLNDRRVDSIDSASPQFLANEQPNKDEEGIEIQPDGIDSNQNEIQLPIVENKVEEVKTAKDDAATERVKTIK